ncbi:uncharacterized protein [Onthophagus taurus]|uniref:uncharacterized protein n=1 Tax=Onthophagus taurus TaxID=166361 RepID=UPI000C1FE95D|nr:uncharacterized protein LOC111426315 [Onthophagus taurus]
MYNGKKDVKFSNPSNVNELDAALTELDTLSSRAAPPRREYLKENNLKMLINTKYVSNVSIGLKVRHVTPTNRYAPYNLPTKQREERHRTRSENNDSNDSPGTSLVKAIIESTVDNVDEISQLKKAKSLESIVGDGGKVDFGNFRLPEVEVVSSCIEKLRVDDER